jgi:hypothetical protein
VAKAVLGGFQPLKTLPSLSGGHLEYSCFMEILYPIFSFVM